MYTVSAKISTDKYQTELSNNHLTILADEPIDKGGTNLGFTPSELLCSSLAACTCITLRMYADKKEWPLKEVRAEVAFDFDAESKISRFKRTIRLVGLLTAEQHEKLLAVANLCPMHKTLSGSIEIETKLW